MDFTGRMFTCQALACHLRKRKTTFGWDEANIDREIPDANQDLVDITATSQNTRVVKMNLSCFIPDVNVEM